MIETDEGAPRRALTIDAVSFFMQVALEFGGDPTCGGNSVEVYHSIFEYAPDAVLVVDQDGRIARVNAQAERLFGYHRDELLGQAVELLIPQRFAVRHIGHRSKYIAEPRLRPMGAGLDLYAKRKDDSEFPVDLMLSPLETHEGRFVMAVVRDITERKQAEQRIMDSLREKEVLLREIHHRVKNNLAVISSLFYLQSTYTQDEPTLRTLQESQDRVRSMALVHETLYQSENFAALDFAEYAQALSDHLLRTYGLAADKIRLHTALEKVTMGIDLAVPCGLILNELLSNALKHAFPHGRSGEIFVGLRTSATGTCLLQVQDDGVGLSADLDVTATRSLGLRLIRSLTRQLDGQFELLAKHPGTEARLTFEVSHEKR
jgi:PAS domain S-box-containing protein